MKMFEDKKETPSLIIPKQLTTFVKGESYSKFLFYIYQYCQEFSQLIKKYAELKDKMKTRVNDYAFFLQKEKLNLTLMEKELVTLFIDLELHLCRHPPHEQLRRQLQRPKVTVLLRNSHLPHHQSHQRPLHSRIVHPHRIRY